MTEDKNIERIEALLRKHSTQKLNAEELAFLAEMGIEAEQLDLLSRAIGVEDVHVFKDSDLVKEKVLSHFNADLGGGQSEKMPNKKAFNPTIWLRYAAILILSAMSITVGYILLQKKEVVQEPLAIVQENESSPAPVEESIPEGDIKEPEKKPANLQSPPPPPPVNVPSGKILDEANEIIDISEEDVEVSTNNMDAFKEEVSGGVELESNTIVRAQESGAVADKKEKESPKAMAKSSGEIGPYPGGQAQLKIDLKEKIQNIQDIPETSYVTVKVIPNGKGQLNQIQILKTNHSGFAEAIVSALKKLNNWQKGNTQSQTYMFFMADFRAEKN